MAFNKDQQQLFGEGRIVLLIAKEQYLRKLSCIQG